MGHSRLRSELAHDSAVGSTSMSTHCRVDNLDCCPVCAALWDETIDQEAHIAECLCDETSADSMDLSDCETLDGSLREPMILHDPLGYGDDALELIPSSWTTTSIHHMWNNNCTNVNGDSKPVGIPYLLTSLYQLLDRSCHDGTIRYAIIGSRNTLHVRSTSSLTKLGVGDSTWGCGYRNIQMVLSAVRHLKSYQALLASHLDLNPLPQEQAAYPHSPPKNYVDDEVVDLPSIQTCQMIIENAWKLGFDPEGCQQFSGQLVGKKKWIGTTEAYVAFTSLGIRARIIDFPSPTGPRGTHLSLTSWIREYFRCADVELETAFDEVMAGQGNPIRSTNKLPLYLQHEGHSQTVFGFEMDSEGHENLLIFDPAKTVPASLKEASIQMIRPYVQRSDKLQGDPVLGNALSSESPDLPSESSTGTSTSISSKTSYLNDLKHTLNPSKRPNPFELHRHANLLAPFRVCINTLSQNEQYQILCIDEGPALSVEEWEDRKTITSTRVE